MAYCKAVNLPVSTTKYYQKCFRPGQCRVSIKSGKATDGSLLKLYLRASPLGIGVTFDRSSFNRLEMKTFPQPIMALCQRRCDFFKTPNLHHFNITLNKAMKVESVRIIQLFSVFKCLTLTFSLHFCFANDYSEWVNGTTSGLLCQNWTWCDQL